MGDTFISKLTNGRYIQLQILSLVEYGGEEVLGIKG